MSTSPPTILVAEDHLVLQDTIRIQLRRQFPGASLLGAENGGDAMRLCRQNLPALILLDSDLDDCDGLQLIGEFEKIVPQTKVIVYSGFVDPFTVYRVSKSSAKGFVAKAEKAGALREAARTVLDGKRYYSESVRALLQELATGQFAFTSRLTEREMEIFGELGCGLSNEEIAEKYTLSPSTVRNHRASIMSKLDLRDVAKLMAYAIKTGFTRQRPNGLLRAVAPLTAGVKKYD